jgi:hypothetical protein
MLWSLPEGQKPSMNGSRQLSPRDMFNGDLLEGQAYPNRIAVQNITNV